VAVDAPGIRRVLAAAEVAKQKNLKVGVGLQRHHDARYLETVQRIHDGAVGQIVYLRAYWNGAGYRQRPGRESGMTEMAYQLRNPYHYTWISGDNIAEQHVHNIDVCNWIEGTHPVSAQGQGGRQVRIGPLFGDIFDHHSVEFTYADGSQLFSQCRHMPGCWNRVAEHVVGTKGKAEVNKGRIEAGADEWLWRGPKTNPYQVEHDRLFEAIRNDRPHNEVESGATATMTAIMGRMATYSGKVISWDEALQSELSLAPDRYAFDATPPVLPGPDGIYPCAVPGVTKVL
jgi:predicted dehydrogenase